MRLAAVMGWMIPLSASMCLALPTFAGSTPEIGSQSGQVYNQECGGESLVIGFEYTSGKALDSVGAICGIRRKGDWTGEIVHKGRVGGGGGSGPFTVLCPPFNAVAGIEVFVDNHDSVRHLGVGCFPVPGPQLTYLNTTNEGGEDNYSEHSDCPPYQFATGIHGHFNALVNSMGLHCMAPVLKQAEPPPTGGGDPAIPPQLEEALRVTGKTPEQCVASNAKCLELVAGLHGGPGNPAAQAAAVSRCQPVLAQCMANAALDASKAIAPDGTTVYKRPNGDESEANVAGYIPRGGEVTVVKCENGFCEISAPVAGFVWGEDIGR